MPYGIDVNGREYAECPCCGRVARGHENIISEFGYRTMENGNVIPQSYCRVCRRSKCTASFPRHPRI